ncbi:unnamed protein product, partial [Meganyctiphanes norvegica]
MTLTVSSSRTGGETGVGGIKLSSKNIWNVVDPLRYRYLDGILQLPPSSNPTTVEIDIEVRSMGRISEMDMTYSMDCYFRQTWVDERLAFSNLDEAFTLSAKVLERLWKPDTFIYNGKQSYVHLITTPNKFFRLYQNGKILYSSRLTINANCPMNLEDFPMDTQKCPLKLGSFGYTTDDVVYKWNKDRQVVIAPDLMLSQFDLIGSPSGFENDTRRAGEFSTLLASFHLQRHMGNFLIQVYGPCMLLVVLSWVSFWLNREATADRISLGITTVLTMTFLGLEARTDLPKVSYVTALDLFVWISYGFIFGTIIEFAFVHVFTKKNSGEIYPEQMVASLPDSGDDSDLDEVYDSLQILKGHRCSLSTEHAAALGGAMGATNGVGKSAQAKPSRSRPWDPKWAQSIIRPVKLPSRSSGSSGVSSRTDDTTVSMEQQEERSAVDRGGPSDPRRRYPGFEEQMNSVSNIDEMSRILFPLAFLLINVLYWWTYLFGWPPS